MRPEILDRLQAANLDGTTLVRVFTQLETVLKEQQSGQVALTLGYTMPNDMLVDGDLIPVVSLTLTEYAKEPNTGDVCEQK